MIKLDTDALAQVSLKPDGQGVGVLVAKRVDGVLTWVIGSQVIFAKLFGPCGEGEGELFGDFHFFVNAVPLVNQPIGGLCGYDAQIVARGM